jgi:hypothetical protein
MSGRVGRRAERQGDVRGLPIALGVLWSPPASPARRKLPRLLVPGGRKTGGSRRRGRHSVRQLLQRSAAAGLALSAWS